MQGKEIGGESGRGEPMAERCECMHYYKKRIKGKRGGGGNGEKATLKWFRNYPLASISLSVM